MPANENGVTRAASLRDRLLLVALAVLGAGCVLALYAARGWPLVGDSALIRYVVFLIHSGKAPYSQIVDINLPGSYLLEALAMKTLGWNAVGLRAYDGLLCGALCAAAWCLPGAERRERLACLGGGLLFLLVHLQDGLSEAGQRDLALAVVLLGGVAVLARSSGRPGLAIFGFELLAGFGLTVKPTLWPMALLPLLLLRSRRWGSSPSRLQVLLSACAGIALAPATAALWLWRLGSLQAFFGVIGSVGLLHGELGRRGLGFLLLHCTAPVTVLFALWLLMLGTRALAFDELRSLLLAAMFCGLVSYLLQGKGLSYQRYPFLALGLVLIGRDVGRATRLQGIAGAVSLTMVAATALWFAPRFTMAVASFDTTAPLEEHLAQALQARPGSAQCLDTFGGCINTLYDMRLPQATGYLYDCYLFSPPVAGSNAVRDAYREQFLGQFNAVRPQTVILTNQPCFDAARNYDRLGSWPAFAAQMARDYRLQEEWHTERTYRWWNRRERPIAFRVYARR